MPSNSMVVLTGAGISAESGIKTFRDQNGLWEDHKIEDVASPSGFRRSPDLVHAFYNARRAQLQSSKVTPNAAHKALAELESRWKGEFLLVTQNVDNLHERAGSKNLLHMHGELLKVRCTKSDQVFSWTADIKKDTKCSCCNEPGTLRPHIVWFDEIPFALTRIYVALQKCDIFVAVGTSGNVYPAAGFVNFIPAWASTVEINLDESLISHSFREHIFGPASKMVPKFVEKIIKGACPWHS